MRRLAGDPAASAAEYRACQNLSLACLLLAHSLLMFDLGSSVILRGHSSVDQREASTLDGVSFTQLVAE